MEGGEPKLLRVTRVECPGATRTEAQARVADAALDLLIKRLKFGAQLPLAMAFASVLLERLRSRAAEPCDVAIPVPLSAERLAERGFNQAMEIARPLARSLGLPVAAQACVRVRDTTPQSMLALHERQGNMLGAFAVRDRSAVARRRILVDRKSVG